MNLKLRKMTAAIAAMAMLMVVAAPYAGATTTYTTTAGSGAFEFNSDPLTFQFHVERAYALGLDAAYWNFTVYSYNINATATNATYYVHIHINDTPAGGSTNLTKNVTVAAKNDRYVWANASHANAAFGAMVPGAATLYVELIKLGSTSPVASYHGTVNLYSSELTAGLINVVMIVIPLILMIFILGWFGGLIEGIKGKIGRR